jgi:RNA polymerase sigma-70 factor (ECF subfamily)
LRGCADALRQRADASSHDDEVDMIERLDAAELAERADVIGRLAKLSPRERDPLLLHVVQGLQYQEIAAMLGIPVGTVQSRISRARTRLARALRPVQEERA